VSSGGQAVGVENCVFQVRECGRHRVGDGFHLRQQREPRGRQRPGRRFVCQ
jgi:hypothetical protein